MEKREFIIQSERLGFKLKVETTVRTKVYDIDHSDCIYAIKNKTLTGFYSPEQGGVIYKVAKTQFSTTGRTFINYKI